MKTETAAALQVYELKITAEYARDFSVVLEMTGDSTLYNFHEMISHAFDLEDGHLHLFTMFPYSRQWDDCYGAVKTHIPRKTLDAELKDLGLEAGQRFQYLFDFGDMLWHWIDVLSVTEPTPGRKYPRFTERHGEPSTRRSNATGELPAPPSLDGLKELKALLLAAMRTRGASESRDKGLSVELLTGEYALALQIHEWALPDERRLLELSERCGFDLISWLLGLPFDLAGAGLIDEASSVCSTVGEVIDPASFLGDRPIYMATAGKHEAALAQVESNLERFPGDPWILIKAGDALVTCGNPERAEALYRQGLLMGSRDRWTRDGALERLLPLLAEQGRDAEASELQEAADQRALREGMQRRSESGFPASPIRRESPKVGRNDPCPCGSGRKFKKCCGD